MLDSYVLVKDGEAFLLGVNITPLDTASTHVIADPTRTKKLLLHTKELSKIFAAIQQKGHTCVAHETVLEGPPGKMSDRPLPKASKTTTNAPLKRTANVGSG